MILLVRMGAFTEALALPVQPGVQAIQIVNASLGVNNWRRKYWTWFSTCPCAIVSRTNGVTTAQSQPDAGVQATGSMT